MCRSLAASFSFFLIALKYQIFINDEDLVFSVHDVVGEQDCEMVFDGEGIHAG